MSVVLETTKSLCPVCLATLPARIVAAGEGVFLEKRCAEHGDFKTIIWRGEREGYDRWLRDSGYETKGSQPPLPPEGQGCPHECGLCPEHASETCSAALMVTNRCNLTCPICFTRGQGEPVYEPSLPELAASLQLYRKVSGDRAFPLELCGGEPTVRDDLPQVISMARDMGFSHIQVNSNGVNLAREPELAGCLRDAGASVIYLGFDGADDAPYLATRGEGLFRIKMQALAHCAQAGLAVVLTPMLVPDLNDHHIGRILDTAKAWSPAVRGVYFQPVSYFGAYPGLPVDHDRLTIPDVLSEIVAQGRGEIEMDDFHPPACEHPLCSFNGLFMVDRTGRLKSLSKRAPRNDRNGAAELARAFTTRQWRANTMRTLSIGGMLFQDAWNIDLARLKRCIIHIISPERGLTPLCAKYLTSRDGRRLYPGLA